MGNGAMYTTPDPSTEDASLGGVFVQKPAAGIATDNDEGGGAFPPGTTGGGGGGGGVATPANNAEITIEISVDDGPNAQGSFTTDQATDEVITFDLADAIETLISNELAQQQAAAETGKRVQRIDYVAPTETAEGSITFVFAVGGTFDNEDSGDDTLANPVTRVLTLPAVGAGGSTDGVTEDRVNELIDEALELISYPYVTGIEITNSNVPGATATATASDGNHSVSLNIASLIPAAVTDAITMVESADGSVVATDGIVDTAIDLVSRPILRGNSNTLSAGDTSTIIPASETINFAELSIDSSTGLVLVAVGNGRYALVAEGTTPVVPVNPPETAGITGDSTIFETPAPDVVLTIVASESLASGGNPTGTFTNLDNEDSTVDVTLTSTGSLLSQAYTISGADAGNPGTYTISVTPTIASGALDTVTESVMRTVPYVTYRGAINEPEEVNDILQASAGVVDAGWPASGSIPVPAGTETLYIAVNEDDVGTDVNRVVYTNGSQIQLNVRSQRTIEIPAGDGVITYNVMQIAGNITGGTLSMFRTA